MSKDANKHMNKDQMENILAAMDSVPEFVITDEVSKFGLQKIRRVLELKGFKHATSKKALEFIESKPLVYEVEPGKYHAIYVRQKGIIHRMLVATKTKSGIVYVEKSNGIVFGFMSHLFDRFAKRADMCSIIDREKAIRTFLQTDFINPNARFVASRYVDDDTREILTLHTKGICVGFVYKGHEILKTFLLEDMMTAGQKKTGKWIKDTSALYERHVVLKSRDSKGILLNTEKEEMDRIEKVLKDTTKMAEGLKEFDDEFKKIS